MPRVRKVVTLKQSCINVIARRFDDMWVQHFERQFGDIPRLLYVISPFSDLPGQLCSDILHTLLSMRLLRRSHLQLLLVPQMTSINFSVSYTSSISSLALDIIRVRCKCLTYLNLTNCKDVSSKAVAESISAFPQLRTLILKQTKMNDQVMKAVANYLPNLIHLDVHACPVTDRGAVWLCGDHGDFNPVCTSLALLDISATKIELSGCCAILQSFPNIQFLSYPDSMEAIARLHRGESCEMNGVNSEQASVSGMSSRTGQSSQPGPSGGVGTTSMLETSLKAKCNLGHQHRLEVLYATALKCRRIEEDSVQLACRHCPRVREVYLYQDVTDAVLKHLTSLQYLSVLEVTSDKPHAVTFHGGLLPLLQARGQDMIALGLYDIHAIDLGLLGWLCPLLQRLKVVSMQEDSDFAHSYLTSQQQTAGFRALRQLTMVFHADMESDQRHLDLLFKADALQELHLIKIQSLTDDVLNTALDAHGFPCLKKVQLESCDGITVSSVTQLLACCGQLSHLSLKHCHNITCFDFRSLKDLAQKEGLDLIIEWE